MEPLRETKPFLVPTLSPTDRIGALTGRHFLFQVGDGSEKPFYAMAAYLIGKSQQDNELEAYQYAFFALLVRSLSR